MVRSLRQLYGKKLGASDGDIGHVKDFYFNDHFQMDCARQGSNLQPLAPEANALSS
jgi:hypothetical protein